MSAENVDLRDFPFVKVYVIPNGDYPDIAVAGSDPELVANVSRRLEGMTNTP